MTTPQHEVSSPDERSRAEALAPVPRHKGRLDALYSGNIRAVAQRGWIVTWRQNLAVVLGGFLEPIFFLLAMGYGLGGLVGTVTGPGGQAMDYLAYIAPALLATSAMNGAIMDATWNVFFKIKFSRLYQTMISTSLGPADIVLGELIISLLRGAIYAVGFMALTYGLGIFHGLWPLLLIPVSLLVAAGFATLGMFITACLRTFQQMDIVGLILLPMLLFSGTFYPIEVYPQAAQWIVQALPLWHAVDLMRQLSVGVFEWSAVGHITYFLAMIVIGLTGAVLRFRTMLLR
ncbi:MAG: ABC transporter permease [Bowdeniella nasicola]|nr:ABC transporter permease [Bowdeniella nasicola]